MGLTFLRLLLLPVFIWLLLADVPVDQSAGRPHKYAALAVFAVMAITDKLDGYLARRLNQASKLGALLDPVADKLLVAASLVLLSSPAVAGGLWAIPIPVVVIVYAKDVLLGVGTIVLLVLRGKVSIKPRLAGKLGTAIQLALVMATILADDLYRIHPGVVSPLLKSLWWATAVVACVAAVDYVVQGVRQLQTEADAEKN